MTRLQRGSGYIGHNPSIERGRYPPPPYHLSDLPPAPPTLLVLYSKRHLTAISTTHPLTIQAYKRYYHRHRCHHHGVVQAPDTQHCVLWRHGTLLLVAAYPHRTTTPSSIVAIATNPEPAPKLSSYSVNPNTPHTFGHLSSEIRPPSNPPRRLSNPGINASKQGALRAHQGWFMRPQDQLRGSQVCTITTSPNLCHWTTPIIHI